MERELIGHYAITIESGSLYYVERIIEDGKVCWVIYARKMKFYIAGIINPTKEIVNIKHSEILDKEQFLGYAIYYFKKLRDIATVDLPHTTKVVDIMEFK